MASQDQSPTVSAARKPAPRVRLILQAPALFLAEASDILLRYMGELAGVKVGRGHGWGFRGRSGAHYFARRTESGFSIHLTGLPADGASSASTPDGDAVPGRPT